MTSVAHGNPLYIPTHKAGTIFMSVNLYNLSQGIVHTLYCVYIENMVARGGNSGEKAEFVLFVALSFYSANLLAQVKTLRNESHFFGARHFNLHQNN